MPVMPYIDIVDAAGQRLVCTARQEDDDAMREAADVNHSVAGGSIPGLEASVAVSLEYLS